MGASHRTRVGTLSLVAALVALMGTLIAVPALAQDEAGDVDEDAPPAQATRNYITVGLGSQRQVVDGNSFRYWQYMKPANGTYPSLIDVGHPLDDEGRTFGVTLRDLLEPTAGGVGYAYDVDLGLRVDSRYRRSEFYRDFYLGANDLRRKDWDTDVRWRITPRDHLTAHYTTVDLRGLLTDPEQNFRDERWGFTYHRNLGAYSGTASVELEQLSFLAGAPYFAGEATTWGLGFGPARDGRTLIAGSAAWTNTDLVGHTMKPDETSLSLSGFRQITDDLSVTGDLEYWELEDSIAQNAYAKREQLASVEGEYTGLWRTTLRAGFETASVDYVNRPQSQVVEPAVNTTSLALRSRPRRDVKLQADFRRRRADDRPLAYDIAGFPVTTRIWEEADMFRARGTYTASWAPVGVTLGYREDDRENSNQGTSNTIVTKDLTAWWAITDDVNASVSLFEQDFGLQGAGLATPYVSDAESWQVGATWQATDRTSLAAGFARADSFGAIELKQSTWSASVDHAWDAHRIRLGFALDDLDDYNGTLLGYDADLWYAEFSTQLP